MVRQPSQRGGASRVVRELVHVKRKSLIEAHERGLIDNTALRRVQASLDMEELELGRGRASGEG